MYNYHVRKRKRTRYTYRFLGFTVMLVCLSQLVMFFMGYGRTHMIGNLFAMVLLLYGLYLFISSFRSGAYDLDYEFRQDDFVVHSKRGDKTYSYSDVIDLSHVIPENENIYSVIHINVGKENYVLPFSYKKEVAETIYNFLNERVTSQKLEK